MARTRLYIDWLYPWGVHLTDFSHPAVYAAVVQVGRVESYRSVEKVLVAVVLADGTVEVEK
jgi:hypothetical protein